MTAAPLTARGTQVCRACSGSHLHSVLDLGEQPLSNRLLLHATDDDPTYPLHLKICADCSLGQVGEFVRPQDIFGEYPYLSSTSTSWLEHARRYASQMGRELVLGADAFVVEVASNDGYLLKEFRDAGHRVLGIEPAGNVAAIAMKDGIPTECAFLGRDTAARVVSEHGHPRLVVANNVLAHVPDLDDFVGGLAILCGPETVITVENPSFLGLLTGHQFDTIYHEHFSYLSAHAVSAVAARHGLQLIRVDQLQTHGGSNRYWLRRTSSVEAGPSVAEALEVERAGGLLDSDVWAEFAAASRRQIEDLRGWLETRASASAPVAAYGAAAKGNTFLNAVGRAAATIAFVVDASPEKQGTYLPGSQVPVFAPDHLHLHPVADVLVLPWNLSAEIAPLIRALAPTAGIWVAVPALVQVP